ncbi:TetR/AcrR family transcriptional regulator [Lewinella cohaerens]|uniref:TetR/AcrR family transcriptional regulator n=1 Tax=Lewinella cohaerens TaxID=70995 RepID=UPI00037901CA|nr:TetR/AcrR family transcriptional regulator [Lewinella cohaerens]
MRYKEYNANNVLEKSFKLFWANGFRGTSINEIVNVTGVNRFSLYHEFENKKGILYASLNLYRDRYCQEKLDYLQKEGDLPDILKGFYLSFIDENNAIPGCYFIHIATELADKDEKVRAIVDTYISEVESRLNALLQREGISSESSNLLARHFLGLYCTAMSFCLIHTKDQREKHVETGIKVILKNYV